MENKAKIVWFDDEYQTLEGIILQFDLAGVAFEGFDNAEQGIAYLKSAYDSIDAVVIDGNFFVKKDDVDINTKGKAISKVLDSLENIKHKKDIPYYVLSGKLNFRNREVDILDNKDIKKVYDKLKTNDIIDLCNHILEDASLNKERQLVNRHSSVFESIQDVHELSKHQQTIINLLVQLGDGKIEFTAIRKVLESLFISLSRIGVIPEKFAEEKGWINGTSVFLSRRHNGYNFHQEIIHPFISRSLYNLLLIVQDGSHCEGKLELKVDHYVQINGSKYFYQSVLYSFLDILIYFCEYIKTNEDKEVNQARWSKKNDIIIDEIQQDSLGNFFVNDCLLSYNDFKDGDWVGKKIEVLSKTENTNLKTKDQYPFFVTKYNR